MITDKFVKGYAVLRSEWFSDNIIDEYIPFVSTIIIENNIDEIDEVLLTKRLNEKYNNIFQESFVKQVLSQAVKKGIIINNRGKYLANKNEAQKYIIRKESFDYDLKLLVNDYVNYAKQQNCHISADAAEDMILKFVDNYDDRVLYNNIEDISIGDNVFLYHWCKYIIGLKDGNQKIYDFLIGLCFGNLVKNALFYANDAKDSFSNLTIYLDTPMVFALLGMDTPERALSYKTLINKCIKVGITVRVFDQNFEEAKGIMERASRWAMSSQYDPSKANKVSQFFFETNMSTEDISEYIHDFEAQLNSLGITKEETNYVSEENSFQLDEEKLFNEIKAEYGRRALKYTSEAEYDNAIQTDVRSIVMVQRKRAGSYSTELKSAKCIFVTTNGVIAKVSKDYTLTSEITKDKIPTCITADLFGTLLWMNYPEKNDYTSQKLLADCKALLKASPAMIAKFNLELEKAYSRRDKDLTEEKFLFLRSHPIVQRLLLDATSGDYTQFDSNTWRQVYDRIVSSAQFEGEKKYEEEKEKHNQTKNELEQANISIKEASEREQILNNRLQEQSNKYSLTLAKIVAVLIYAVPYVAISLVVIFIQSLFVDWSAKGIVLGALTVLLVVLLPIFYKKLVNKLQIKFIKKINANNENAK